MPTEEQMTVNERRKYLKLVKPRYQQAKRGERSRLLTYGRDGAASGPLRKCALEQGGNAAVGPDQRSHRHPKARASTEADSLACRAKGQSEPTR